MGVYGVDYYGSGRFGRDPSLVRPDFDVSPFTFMALDYGTLHLTWQKPHTTDCTFLRLVRNPRNLPQDENDGLYLWGDSTTTPTYADPVERTANITDPGLGSGFFYYTMWGWSNTDQIWVRCTDLIALVPINWGYGYRLYSLLPMSYRDQDVVLVDPYNPWPVDDPRPPLRRFLSLLGFQLDFLRTELESLMSVNDAMNCSGALLPLLAQQLGLPNEPEIGMQQERQLIQNAIHLYKNKGSPRGINEFASILTSFPMTQIAHHGYNCLLSRDDGVGETSTGTWQAWPPSYTGFAPPVGNNNIGLAILQIPNLLDGTITGMTNPLEVYPGFVPGGNTERPYGQNNNSSGIQVQGTSTNALTVENSSFEAGTIGNWTGVNSALANTAVAASAGTRALQMTCNTATSNPSASLASQAATAGNSYTFRGSFRPWQSASRQTTPRTIQVQILWFNGATANGSSTAVRIPEVLGKWVTATVTATAPANTTTATLQVTVLTGYASTGELHLLDNFWFAPSATQDLYLTTGRIPITDFMSASYGPGYITWRIQIWSSVARQVELLLYGDPGNGAPFLITSQTFTETVNHWTQMTVTTNVNPYANGLGNAARYYHIFPVIHIKGVTSESHYLTLMGLWPCTPGDIGVNTPIYDYPRDVKIIVGPQSANLLSNTCTSFANGFDGLTSAADPTQATSNLTSTMSIHFASVEDAASLYAVNGIGSLQIDATTPATTWWGLVNRFTMPPPQVPPLGWFSAPTTNWVAGTDTGDWFPFETTVLLGRTWMDPTYGWNTQNNNYYTLGTETAGQWFYAAQPPQNGNLAPFVVQPNQQFNFSLYARSVKVLDPSNAFMVMGFRWYYPDNTWAEVTTSYTITDQFVRYTMPPPPPPPPPQGESNAWMSNPPLEMPLGTQPIGMYPFVRFPNVASATFLINSAMLSPGSQVPAYMDVSLFPGSPDYVQDAHGASYYYRRRVPRMARLTSEIYRWIPMGASHTEVFGSGALVPPLDPTNWAHPVITLRATASLTATPT